MKPSLLDKFIGFFNPAAELRRLQFKAAKEVLARGYDGANSYPTSDWISAQKTSANAEIRNGREKLQLKSRDLARNNPYSLRALNVIVSNTVGAGIVANIKGRTKTQEKKIKALWKQVAESRLCDSQGIYNFYGLQALALRAVVESGEVIALKQPVPNKAPQLKMLEADFIVSALDRPEDKKMGIKVDENGKALTYSLYEQHPGDVGPVTNKWVERDANTLMHVFRQDRPGQIRGVPWAHAIIEKQKDFDDYQYSTLIRQKIAACFGGFIKSNGSDALLSPADKKKKREAEMKLTPGVVRYLDPGEEFQYANPPGNEGYGEYNREQLRSIAVGWGISYEAFTGDYSQVNFSSGRMGHMEFRRNIESWRWQMLIPMFCDPYFQFFLEWAKASGYDVDGVTVEWVPPAYTMIDPTKEIAADKDAIRAGLKSRAQVIREQGMEPEAVLAEIKAERDEAKSLGLTFDVDYAFPPPIQPPQQSGQGSSSEEQSNSKTSETSTKG